MSNLSIWSYPTRIIYGAQAVAKVGDEARRLGGTSALLVTDQGVQKAGLLAPIEGALSQRACG